MQELHTDVTNLVTFVHQAQSASRLESANDRGLNTLRSAERLEVIPLFR